MPCTEDRERLSAYLDGELTPGERAAVESHLSGCGDCARVLAEWKRIGELFAAVPRHAAPASVREAVRAAMPSPAPRRGFRPWMAAAAVALLGIGVAYATRDRWTPVQGQQLAEAPAPAQDHEVAVADRPAAGEEARNFQPRETPATTPREQETDGAGLRFASGGGAEPGVAGAAPAPMAPPAAAEPNRLPAPPPAGQAGTPDPDLLADAGNAAPAAEFVLLAQVTDLEETRQRMESLDESITHDHQEFERRAVSRAAEAAEDSTTRAEEEDLREAIPEALGVVELDFATEDQYDRFRAECRERLGVELAAVENAPEPAAEEPSTEGYGGRAQQAQEDSARDRAGRDERVESLRNSLERLYARRELQQGQAAPAEPSATPDDAVARERAIGPIRVKIYFFRAPGRQENP